MAKRCKEQNPQVRSRQADCTAGAGGLLGEKRGAVHLAGIRGRRRRGTRLKWKEELGLAGWTIGPRRERRRDQVACES